MFSSPRFLAYINKPSVYYLKRSLPEEKRVQILKQLTDMSSRQVVTASNPVYRNAFEIMKQQKIDQVQKYEDSFLWSPKYTPNNFKYSFLIPLTFVLLLGLYIRFIAIPKNMMMYKRKYGVRFPESESLGYLDGWYDEYMKKDKVL